MKNRLIITIAGCLLASGLFSQSTFNNRFYYQNQTELFNVYPMEIGYILSGWSADTIGADHFDLILLELTDNGETISIVPFGEWNRPFWTIGGSETAHADFFIQASTGVRNDSTAASLTWFNSDLDTLFTRDFRSPYLGTGALGEDFLSPVFTRLNPDSSVFLSMEVYSETTYNDALIYKLDPSGQEIWHYEHATASDPDIIYGLVPHEGGVIAGILELGYTGNPTNHVLKKLDNNGNEIWSLNSDDYLLGLMGFGSILIDQDTLVISGSYEEPGMQDVYSIASIYKIDTLGNLIWSNTFGDYTNYDWREFTNLTQTTDGHYVCGGTWTTEPGSEEIPEGELSPDYDQFAHIVKFDRNNGDIIWERKYRWLETYHDRHNLYDMKATPDGGLIFCGSAVDLYQFYDPPLQQGWVVKLDECGCLVPGCDVSCEVGVHEEEELLTLKIGPNPTSDLLNIFIGESTQIDFNGLQLEVTDLFGRVIHQNPIKYSGTTYIFDVSNYAAGQYVVSLVLEGSVLASEKFVVKK